MINNPIYINENSGSGGYENNWDPRNMKEDVMLDLSNYSNVLHISGNGGIYESDDSTRHIFDVSKHLIIATYGNNITIEFNISSKTGDLAFIVSSSTSGIQYFKIKLPQEANGKTLICSGNAGNIKAIYLEN